MSLFETYFLALALDSVVQHLIPIDIGPFRKGLHQYCCNAYVGHSEPQPVLPVPVVYLCWHGKEPLRRIVA